MKLSALAEQLKGRLYGEDAQFNSVAIDTRTLEAGELYVAIQGRNFDGNDFVRDSENKGASGAIVNRLADLPLPQLLVGDTTVALGGLAQLNRRRSDAVIIGITGSQGKTTVKEMVGRILGQVAPVLVTRGNLNNEIGVPLTLLRLAEQHSFGVIEMGANHAGEIQYSVGLVEPDIAIITNAASAHIEGFGSLEGVSRAKGEIIDGVSAGGTMVLNADDQFFDDWKRRSASQKTVCFSTHDQSADYFAGEVQSGKSGELMFNLVAQGHKCAVRLPLLGKHNVNNAVAAAAVAMEAGASLNQVVEGLGQMVPVNSRMDAFTGLNECRVIDDSYNASPSSFRAAIDALADFKGCRVLVMGDMAELGEETRILHEELGEYAANAGIDRLWALGQFSSFSAAQFGEGATTFQNKSELVNECKKIMRPDVTLLVKGSRSAGMDDVVEALREFK